MNVLKAAGRAISQFDDPAFRKVILVGIGASAAVMIATFVALLGALQLIPGTGVGWLDSAIEIGADLGLPIVFLLALWLLFPAVMSFVISLLLDDIVEAVERRYYPARRGSRRPSLPESVWLAAKLSLIVLIVNILALPLYVTLWITGIGSLLLYLALNGWLLGREYFEIVALHHLVPADAARLRRIRRGDAFAGGVVIALLFIVPVVNLVAPVIGAAMMTHLFHLGGGSRREPA